MRLLTYTFALALFAICSLPLYAQDSWESSPYNWKNSPYKWENSKHNPRNSPDNWFNTDKNPRGPKIEGTFGQTVGYAVRRKDGGVNYFDNDGDMIGFSKDGKKSYNLDGEEEKFDITKKDQK